MHYHAGEGRFQAGQTRAPPGTPILSLSLCDLEIQNQSDLIFLNMFSLAKYEVFFLNVLQFSVLCQLKE